jgi:competence protein ComEC
MPLALLIFSAAVLSVGLFPSLPSLHYCLIPLPLLFFLKDIAWRSLLFAVCAGLSVGIFSGHQYLSNQLSSADSNQDYLLTGYITDLPKQGVRQIRFVVDVERLIPVNKNKTLVNLPKKIQLSWYANRYEKLPELNAGDLWQWRVKLQKPRSLVNPAGFDYQVWLMRNGIGATGYVLKGSTEKIATDKDLFSIERQRQHLQSWIVNQSQSPQKGILIALLIGDTSLVNKKDWLLMQQTGTNHLIAISGLHVGFLAIVGYYLGLLLGRFFQLFHCRWPAFYFAYAGAIIFAAYYSALAGFNIPTIRTLMMLSLFYAVCFLRREAGIVHIFSLALAMVVIIDPLAAYDIGFWLSFGAVSLLILFFSGRKKIYQQKTLVHSMQSGLIYYLQSQWVMFIGLIIPLLVLIHSVSLSAPIANALAIPVITFFVVPCLLLASVLESVSSVASIFLLDSAAFSLEYLHVFLRFLLNLAPGKLNPSISLSPAMGLWAGFCILLLLLPKGLFSRKCIFLLLLFLFVLNSLYPKPDQPDLSLLVMDVGQGTAVVIRAGDKTLVYDTGAAFSKNFDAGSGIISPYLRSQAITKIDKLVISHNDLDHAGGLQGLLETIDVDELLLGQYIPLFMPTDEQETIYAKAKHTASCHQSTSWKWQEVEFRFVKWPLRKRASANNYSCVLLIEYHGQKILLPGDLEKEIEYQLLRLGGLPKNINILLAGHHGSLTSSSPEFINLVKPEMVVYSAGFQNRYGHPHPKVRARFQAINSREFNTANQGALEFTWRDGVALPALAYRQVRKRYWFDDSFDEFDE